MKKILISSDLLGLPWQHGIYDRTFKQVFLTIMFCLLSVSKNSKIIQTYMFSEIVRPKMGLIDPSPLFSCPQNVKEGAYIGLVRPALEYGSSVRGPYT